jgi:UDPglucose--hexose-1-phosphate uridylyltransferase
VNRRNRITGEPVILAPERAHRPDITHGAAGECPFCPGNEALTPPEIWRDGDPWHLRVFPNKYPATEQHEVIVESPRHDDTFDQIPRPRAGLAIDVYIRRYQALSGSGLYVSLFKNHGPLAGATIPHIHSQILVTQFVPPRVAREIEAFTRVRSCPLCNLEDEPTIDETADFRWISPRGAASAYEQWIVPKRHKAEIGDAGDLAPLLQKSTRATNAVAASHNWVFMNFPRQPAAHWYLQIIPRLTTPAGFELGSGSGINVVDPEEAADHLQKSL